MNLCVNTAKLIKKLAVAEYDYYPVNDDNRRFGLSIEQTLETVLECLDESMETCGESKESISKAIEQFKKTIKEQLQQEITPNYHEIAEQRIRR